MLRWQLSRTPLIHRRDRPRKVGPAQMVPKQTSTRFPPEDDDSSQARHFIILPTFYLLDFSSSLLCILEGFIHTDGPRSRHDFSKLLPERRRVRECVCAFAINYYIFIAGGAYSKEGSIWSSSVAFSFLRQVHTSPCTTTSQPPA